jgi:hypothetical protein
MADEPTTEIEPDADAAPERGRNWLRVGLATTLALLLLVIGTHFAWNWYEDRSYVGTSEAVTIKWDCANGLFWTGPAGHRWWAGHDPVPTGELDTAPPTNDDILPTRTATGTMHYDTRMTATFTSDAGGTLTFIRQPSEAFYFADCKLGF